MEQEPKDITDRQIYETSIGPVCMSKTEYAMYQEEMAKKIGNLHIYVDADACPVIRIVEKNILFRLLSYVTQIMYLNQITVK